MTKANRTANHVRLSTAAMTTETAANCAQARSVAVTSDLPTPSRPICETPSPSANKTPSETINATPNEGACDITLKIRRARNVRTPHHKSPGTHVPRPPRRRWRTPDAELP